MITRIGNETTFLNIETAMTYGEKLKYKQAQTAEKVRYKGNEMIAELPKPEPRQSPDVRVLSLNIKSWSKVDTNGKTVPITVDNILADTELGDLFEEALDTILVANKIRKPVTAEQEDKAESDEEIKN